MEKTTTQAQTQRTYQVFFIAPDQINTGFEEVRAVDEEEAKKKFRKQNASGQIQFISLKTH